MKSFLKFILIGAALFSTDNVYSQSAESNNSELRKKAQDWVSALQINDAQKSAKVENVIVSHLTAVREWHNAHPSSTVPDGINPVTGNKLSDLDKQIIADSAMPIAVHESLMNGLNESLTPEQVEVVLDKYTVGKVAFTIKGYKAIVPDLTAEEESKILSFLKQAREQAVDYKNMKEISAIFEIYKTKSEQMLNNNGRSWRALYAAYTKKIKEEKAAKQKQ
ncbi:DUF3826 domain-containing protein [Pedobacter sp. AW1-32]|uniref:DUF3826 domain-containing protein n=1 Tax=Pedobacter sp. AW1-32 TaxID=3383026 RepID=UPI003FF09F0E